MFSPIQPGTPPERLLISLYRTYRNYIYICTMKNKTLTCATTEEVYDAVRKMAGDREWSVSKVIETALKKYFKLK